MERSASIARVTGSEVSAVSPEPGPGCHRRPEPLHHGMFHIVRGVDQDDVVCSSEAPQNPVNIAGASGRGWSDDRLPARTSSPMLFWPKCSLMSAYPCTSESSRTAR